LTVNADIQNKLLKGDLAQRRMLLTRLTLMLYELSCPGDGESTEAKMEKLRTADYGDKLPAMLKELDRANHFNPHYRGCAWHSYNDARTKDR
jgi:hypothetical protein